jgi:amidohydrolase
VDLAALADQAFDVAVDTRRQVHAHPELGYEERVTTDLVRQRLAPLRLIEQRCPTDTGGVFWLEGGLPGRRVLLRADIDALPVEEEVDVPFRSQIEGRMHACGHDAHVAILLAVAEILAGRAESLPGSYVFLFQPAEELMSGARRMIDGGVLDGLGAERAIGLHVTSPLPTGLVAVRSGIAMSRAQKITARLHGSGGHGAQAVAEGNVVLAVASLAARLPRVVEGMEYEWSSCACSAGVITAGTAPNITPRDALLEGTLRTYTEDQFADAVGRLRATAQEVAAEFSVSVDLDLPDPVPPVVNDGSAVEVFTAAAGDVIGRSNVIGVPPVPQSDDVSEFLRRIPGVYFLVGARPGTALPPQHHSPEFAIDEESIRVGIKAMAAGAVALAATAPQG